MVYAPQRRHAVASLSTTFQALAILQHLYAPSFWVLLGRLLAQLQIRAPPLLSPTRSLMGLFFVVTVANGFAVLVHWASGPPDGSRGVPLDFVGQKNSASVLRIILLDVVIYLLQLITLVVCYIVNYGPTVPASSIFPYDDLLLPPDTPQAVAESDIDVETGDQFRQRRMGKGPSYQQVAGDDSDLWLDQDGELDGQSLRSTSNPALVATSYSARRHRSGVPLIFNLSLSHLVNLIFRLPSPAPLAVTSGGTPLQTPPPTPPRPTHSDVSLLAAAVARAVENREQFPPTVPARPPGEQPSQPSSQESSDHEEEESRSRRLPGDYWASRANP